MDYLEYRKALAALDLTQAEASSIVGSDARTGRRWATGETAIPGSVALLVRMWLDDPSSLEASRRIAAARYKRTKKRAA